MCQWRSIADAGSKPYAGLDLNSTSATPTSQAQATSTAGATITAPFNSAPVFGVNFLQGLDAGGTMGASFANGAGAQVITLQIND